jgi:hypothetical protein
MFTLVPGGRRIARPNTVQSCPECLEALLSSYPSCTYCRATLDSYWLADWHVLLDHERIQAGSSEEHLLARRVMEEYGSHSWTVVDSAISLLNCSKCLTELDQNYPSCDECGWAFGLSIYCEFNATPNEHALHIGRWVLRFPQVHSAHALVGWRLSLPRILTGWLPSTSEAQYAMNLIKLGRMEEVYQGLQKIDRAIAANVMGH